MFKRFGTKRLIEKGIGPFGSRFLRALMDRECMRCGGHVAEMSLTTNSIVVLPGRVVLLCINCRGGERLTVDGPEKGWLDVSGILTALGEHTCFASGEKLDWYQSLVALRFDIAYFVSRSSFKNPREAFVTRKHMERRSGSPLRYGEAESAGNCPECGAAWRATSHRPASDDLDATCGHCGTPNRLQWHMRISEEKERAYLLDAV